MTNLSNDLPSPTDRSTPSSPPTERAPVGQAQKQGNDIDPATADGREGATDEEVGDRTGPGAGYDMEPEQDKDRGGVA